MFKRIIKMYLPRKIHERLDGANKLVKSPAFLRTEEPQGTMPCSPCLESGQGAGSQETSLMTLISQGSKRFIRQPVAKHKMINDGNKHMLSAKC